MLAEARGKSRRQIEELIARRFPRPDPPASVEPLAVAIAPGVSAEAPLTAQAPIADPCSGAGRGTFSRLEPLSPTRLRVQFTARAEVYDKLEKVRELLSHAVPSGDLGELFERALDALITQETRKRFGSQTPRKPRKLEPGSRHVPARIRRAVWERDGAQCTHVDGDGQRCNERRFLTLEHRIPFALGGSPTLDNLCLLCQSHNLESARQVFGTAHVEAKVRARQQPVGPAAPLSLDAAAKVQAALRRLGFRRSEASAAVGKALGNGPALDVEQLLRASLQLLLPAAS